MIKEITLEHGLHNNRIRLFLKFSYDARLIEFVKSLHEAKWSHTKKCWHIPYEMEMPDKLKIIFAKQGVDVNYINEFMELPTLQSTKRKPNDSLPGSSAEHVEKLK